MLTTIAWTIASLALTCAVVGGGVLLVFYRRAIISFLRRRRSPNLLQELCHRHGLNRTERRLIVGLAKDQRAAEPALAFVDSRLWDAALSGPLGKQNGAALSDLRQRLFSLPNGAEAE
jgi:hypothetical protein